MCPTQVRQEVQIANSPSDLPNDTNFLYCRLTPNANLPANEVPPGTRSVYFSIWNEQTVQASSGLFKDLGSCQSSTTVAMSYTCPLVKTNAELESEVAHILQA